MIIEKQIENKLTELLQPAFLQIENESYMHSVPDNSETHFKVTVASDAFDGKRLIGRHRMINQCLAQELAGPVHALALHTYTPEEWSKKTDAVPKSPNCLGGSK